MLRTIYGFDDLGRKVPTGSYDDGYNPVGGRIFYIDSNSDETVKFYDAQFQEIANVAVGDTPAYYKVTSAGVSGKEKYYVWGGNVFYRGSTRFLEFGYRLMTTIPDTNVGIGYGKINCNTILQIEDTSGRYDYSIWRYLNEHNQSQVNNTNDWYIGSKDEMEELRLFASQQGSSLVDQKGTPLINQFSQCWSSSVYDSKAYFYYLNWNPNPFDNQGSGIPIRSF